MPPRSGLALLVCIGILGVLAVLGTTFVLLARLERQASQRRIHATQAFLLARSGIEDAQARLAAGQDALSPVMEPCPLRQALRPSFFVSAPAGTPILIPVEGRDRGYSGALSHASTQYALRLSGGGGFCVNGGDPSFHSDPTAVSDANTGLRRLLGLLAEAIDREDGLNDGAPVDGTDGFALVDRRPLRPEGWTGFGEIREVLGDARLEALEPYLCLGSWSDKRVVRPNAPASMENVDYASWGEIKLAHRQDRPGSVAPDFERLAGRLVGRCPVSLPWARHRRPALIALIAGLKGLYLDNFFATTRHATDSVGRMMPAELLNLWSGTDDCHVAAEAILTSTSALDTWQGFNEFCDTLPLSGTGDLLQARRDLLKANFNPNTGLNKLGPNLSAFKLVDKADLLASSTEFSLYPVAGEEIDSLGRVLDPSGRLLASRRLSIRLAPPSLVRLSTQRELVSEDLGNLDLPGDERMPRLPGFLAGGMPAFITSGNGTGFTWGHAFLPGRGVSLQSYPEPCFDTTPFGGATSLEIRPADYDGALQLATLETPRDSAYGATAAGGIPPDLKMLGRFDDAFDLDVYDCLTESSAMNVPDLLQARQGDSVMDAIRPNTLYPDGAYSERDRTPAFHGRDNMPPLWGMLSFWVKPNRFDRHWGFGQMTGMRGLPLVHATNYGTPFPNLNANFGTAQPFLIGHIHFARLEAFQTFFEISHVAQDYDFSGSYRSRSHGFSASFPSPRERRWYLASFYWDFRVPDAPGAEHLTGELVIDDGTGLGPFGAPANSCRNSNYVNDRGGNDGTATSDLTAADVLGPHLISLGRHNRPWEQGTASQFGGGADSTFDEFAVYDFGPGLGDSTSPAWIYGLNRYRDGRYYREGDYPVRGLEDPGPPGRAAQYFSAPITLPAGSLVRRVSWTFTRPPELSADYAEVSLVKAVPVPGWRYLWGEALSRSVNRVASSSQAWMPGLSAMGGFRLHAVFRRAVALPLDIPVLDSPVLDDLTVIYSPPEGIPARRWEDRAP